MDFVTVLMLILAYLIVAGGIAGLVLPILPGPFLIFAGLTMAAWLENFDYVGTGTILLLGILMVAAFGIDFLAGALGVKRFGGSQRAVFGALVGSVVGLFFALPGIIFGPFIGAVIGQISNRDSFRDAGKAGLGVWLGIVLGTAAKVTIGLVMVGIYILVRFF